LDRGPGFFLPAVSERVALRRRLICIKVRRARCREALSMVPAEPLHDIAHLGSVELLTPEPEKSLWYFRDLLGMEMVHRTATAVYLRGYGDHAASTLKLTSASAPGVGCIAWRATSLAALERRAGALQAAGLGVDWTNGDFGRGRSFRFRDPDGHLMEIS
jgi:catechol 2,3-dioxygenase-like lactoylglutathione lyase family enzyme